MHIALDKFHLSVTKNSKLCYHYIIFVHIVQEEFV